VEHHPHVRVERVRFASEIADLLVVSTVARNKERDDDDATRSGADE